jgi:dTDP-4-amino-4,6-dideoxygalactose transaminase
VTTTTARLDDDAIQWRRWWGPGTHRHPAFDDVPRLDLAVTESVAPRVIGLPFFEGLTPSDVERVVGCLP